MMRKPRVADEKNYEKLKSDYEAILKTLEEHDTAARPLKPLLRRPWTAPKRRR